MKRKIYILHEDLWVNHFIEEQVQEYGDEDTAVSLISLYPEGLSFPYEQEKQAYDFSYRQLALMLLLSYFHKNYWRLVKMTMR